jgi:hypothetical protein
MASDLERRAVASDQERLADLKGARCERLPLKGNRLAGRKGICEMPVCGPIGHFLR